MWSPTHVQVTVSRARNLIVKGKSGTNDAYVTIKLGDEKYQTSIKERSENPEWMEECDLPLVDMSGVIHLNAYHRNLLGIDEFLGHVDIPLEQFKIYERPRSRWYALRNKTGSKKAEKYRGEIEVKITFIVQSMSGSHASLNKTSSSSKGFKRSSSIKTLAHSVGEKLTVKWPSKGSLTISGSANSDIGDQSPTVRKFDKRDLTRSHTILPTSFNNQHLQEDQQSQQDEVDSTGTNDDPKGRDLERWTNVGQAHDAEVAWYFGTLDGCMDVDPDSVIPLAPFRRKKKSRLSKMNILSQSTLTLDAGKSSPSAELCNDSDLKDSRPLLHKPMLAKSMFDLSTPTIEEISGLNSHSEIQHSDSENEMESESVPKNYKSPNNGSTDDQICSSGSEGEDEASSPDSSSPDRNSSKQQSGSYSQVTMEMVAKETQMKKKEPEDKEDEEELLMQRKDKYKRMKEVNRRHTIGRNVARATAHDLHAGIAEYKRAQEQKDRPLPEEVMDQFKDHSREDLVRLILEQRHLLVKKDTYNRDLEDYIDNLLVKVMEVTPKLLMHPSSRPSPPKAHRGITNGFQQGGSTAPQTPAHSQPVNNHKQDQPSNQKQVSNKNTTSRKNVINANNSNNFGVIGTRSVSDTGTQKANKKQFNPFKKLQQALK